MLRFSLRQTLESSIKRLAWSNLPIYFQCHLCLQETLKSLHACAQHLQHDLMSSQKPELHYGLTDSDERNVMQVALELGSERVLWTSNGIAPHSIDEPGVGKATFRTAFFSAHCTTFQRGHQDACASGHRRPPCALYCLITQGCGCSD